MIVHTRRNDEVEATWCGELTLPTPDVEDMSPVAIVGLPGEVAIYADAPYPHGATLCAACHDAHLSWLLSPVGEW